MSVTRLFALLLVGIWTLGLGVVGIEEMLENAHYLGFAAFFFLAGRGPISIDRLLFPVLEPSRGLMRYAVPALRIGVGISFVVVSFTEKLANLPLARAFLEEYPLNFTDNIGLALSDTTFILSAGTVELIVGLCLVFGIFMREIILLAWLPFNLTLTVFDWTELVGHLPFYGVMALLVWAPDRDDRTENRRLWVRGLREGPLAIGEAEAP